MRHWVVLAVLALLGACTRNPVSGRPELTLMSAAEERRIGAEQAAEVARTIGLVDDPRLGTYVQELGRRLAARSPRRDVSYTFAVVDMAEPNAFALPGGEIFVSRGLLVLANFEDELAGVLGHEIGHVAARHAARRVTRAASAPIAASDADLLAHLDGLPVGASARDGVFEGETFRHPDLGFAVRLPAGWKAGNGRSAIGAVAPDGGAIVLLDGATTGTDPVEAERAFEKEAGSGPLPNTEKLTIAGLPAVHAVAVIDSRRGPLALDLTWIAYAGRVYRITGIAPAGRAEAFRAAWRETAASFRPLTASERRAIRETRLRIARARHGETIGDVVRRTGSAWSAEEAAVANEVAPGDVLGGGRPVKVAMTEPYVAGY